MAYSRANLQRIGPQNRNAPSLWMYADTGSALTAIDLEGYFNDASDVLKVNDLVFAVGSSNTFGLAVVRSNTRDLTANPPVEGVVDMSNFTALGAVDSD